MVKDILFSVKYNSVCMKFMKASYEPKNCMKRIIKAVLQLQPIEKLSYDSGLTGDVLWIIYI